MGWFLPVLSILGMGGQAQATSDATASQQFGSTIMQGQQAVQEGATRDKTFITIAVVVAVVVIMIFAFKKT